MFGVNEFDFLLSVCGNANFIEFISNAKSGQFFFYSSDGKYMIKTMTNTESKFLRRSKYPWRRQNLFFLPRTLSTQIPNLSFSSVLEQYFHITSAIVLKTRIHY
jgi:1-phosphatidylinositol-4-phosphate 5-kinase